MEPVQIKKVKFHECAGAYEFDSYLRGSYAKRGGVKRGLSKRNL